MNRWTSLLPKPTDCRTCARGHDADVELFFLLKAQQDVFCPQCGRLVTQTLGDLPCFTPNSRPNPLQPRPDTPKSPSPA